MNGTPVKHKKKQRWSPGRKTRSMLACGADETDRSPNGLRLSGPKVQPLWVICLGGGQEFPLNCNKLRERKKLAHTDIGHPGRARGFGAIWTGVT
jgi:hypothetical protein